ERLLGEVLGVVRVAGEPVGEAVHPVRVLAHHVVPAGRGPAGGLLTGQQRAARQGGGAFAHRRVAPPAAGRAPVVNELRGRSVPGTPRPTPRPLLIRCPIAVKRG